VFLVFTTSSNGLYDVQMTTDLVFSAWSVIASNIAGTGSTVTYTNVGGATVPKRFYRVGQQ
jgi:hypothetical protein